MKDFGKKIRASLILEDLISISDRIKELEAEIADARAERDEILVDLSPFISATKLAKAAGISTQMVYRIAPPLRNTDDL